MRDTVFKNKLDRKDEQRYFKVIYKCKRLDIY